MEKPKTFRQKVFEILEGGLRGNTAARIFSWTMIILILLSITFLIIQNVERFEPFHEIFEIIETVTIGLFTLELILGFWTADLRFPGHPRPRMRYMVDFMTNVQLLAILPFYMGLLLSGTPYTEIAEWFELLKLLHLLKIGELGLHAWKEKKEGQ